MDGDHQGHKFIVKTSSRGVCDCGDIDGIQPQGFCKHHSGLTTIHESIDENTMQQFTNRFVKLTGCHSV